MFDYLKCKGFSRVFKAKNQFPESSGYKGCNRLQDYYLLDDIVIKAIFDNVRNIGLSVLPLVISKALLTQKELQIQLFPFLNTVVAFILILLGWFLFWFNAIHGVKKILELVAPHRHLLKIVLITLYALISTSIFAFSIFMKR